MREPRNGVRLGARIIARESLRYTPGGVPAVSFRLKHASRQTEAGLQRQAECEIDAVALGPDARLICAAPLEADVEVSGFLAARSARSTSPVLHVTNIEFVEGNGHGFQTEVEDPEQAQG